MSGIGWCSNVLAATSVGDLCADLSQMLPSLPPGTPVGLWLSATMLTEDLQPLQSLLKETGTPVLGLNAFPFDAFHAEIVKRDVYRPAWGDPARTQYTIDAAAALASLVPRAVAAGVTTVPIGWPEDDVDLDRAAGELCEACGAICDIGDAHGSALHLAIEPEPGCIIGTAHDLADFVRGSGLDRWAEAGVLQACLDACHLAVMHESPQRAVQALTDAGVRIGRIQLSSCPQSESAAALAPLTEPRWLHQTSCLADGELTLFSDISDAVERPGTWRCHLHVPIHLKQVGSLKTTQRYIEQLMKATATLPDRPAIEIETYAWSVLPADVRAATLADDLCEELRWAASMAP